MSEPPPRSPFLDRQHRAFEQADTRHFFWQTGNPYFARTERELLGGFLEEPGRVVLDLGCGEGGNLVNLFSTGGPVSRRVVGVDLFPAKLRFARTQFPAGRFVCGDAGRLPFRNGVFDLLLTRDVLHHLEDPEPALREIYRVAKPGARIWIVEPNGRNPLVRLFAAMRPHERGQLRNSVESIRSLVSRYFRAIEIEVRQPFPLSRMVLHYQFGLPRLGFWRPFGVAMDCWDRLCRAAVPRRWWAYIVARAERPS